MRTSRVSLPPFSTFIFDKGDHSDRSATASGSVDSEVDELEDDPECASTPARTMVFSPSPPPQSAIPRTPSECSSGSLVPYPPWATGSRRSTYSVHCSPDYTNCTYSRQTSIAPELRSHSHEAIIPTARELRRRHTDYAEYTYSRQSSTAPSPRPSAREASVPAPAGPSRRPARSRTPSPKSEDDARDMASDAAAPRSRTSTPERRLLDAHPPRTPERPAAWDSDATTAREPSAVPDATKKRRRDSAPLREEKADRARQYRKRAKDAQVALDQVLPESKRVKPGESYILTMDHAREHIHELNRTIAELTGRLKYHQRAAQDAAEESGDEENVYEGDVREGELHVAKRSRLA